MTDLSYNISATICISRSLSQKLKRRLSVLPKIINVVDNFGIVGELVKVYYYAILQEGRTPYDESRHPRVCTL